MYFAPGLLFADFSTLTCFNRTKIENSTILLEIQTVRLFYPDLIYIYIPPVILCQCYHQACHNFFVKKPKIFENVKSKRAAANFQKTRTLCASTIISKNSQILGIKNMFAGSIITMNMIQHYFCLILMNQKLIYY